MKTCRQGHQMTPENTYIWGGHNHKTCRTCDRARSKRTYARNGPEQRKQLRKTYQDRRAQLLGLLGGCCIDCGYNEHNSALDFDHISRNTKSFGLSGKPLLYVPWEKLMLEAAKCEIRCANCHRVKTQAEKILG